MATSLIIVIYLVAACLVGGAARIVSKIRFPFDIVAGLLWWLVLLALLAEYFSDKSECPHSRLKSLR